MTSLTSRILPLVVLLLLVVVSSGGNALKTRRQASAADDDYDVTTGASTVTDSPPPSLSPASLPAAAATKVVVEPELTDTAVTSDAAPTSAAATEPAETTTEDPNKVTVEVQQGRIRGKILDVGGKKVNTFLGVKYAEAPLGKRRYKVAEKAHRWEGVKEATEYEKNCYQWRDNSFDSDKDFVKGDFFTRVVFFFVGALTFHRRDLSSFHKMKRDRKFEEKT